MYNHKALCWINNKIIPANQASISVFDHGFLYGDGVFEGIRFYHNTPFRLDAHLHRLADSAQAIALTMPSSLSALEKAIVQLIHRFEGEHGYIRLIITRGKGCLGINPKNCKQPTTVIIVDSLNMVDSDTRKEVYTSSQPQHANLRLMV